TRGQLLVELIKIDLDQLWRRTADAVSGPRLEEYVSRFPELGPVGQLPTDLIQEEYHVRHCWGDRPGHGEFLERFGAQADRLGELLAKIDAELTQDAPSIRETPRTNGPGPAVPVASAVLPVDSVLSFLDALRALPLLKPAHLNEVIREDLQGRFAA